MSARPTLVTWTGDLAVDQASRSATVGFVVAGAGDGSRIVVSLPFAEAKLLALAILEREAWAMAPDAGRAAEWSIPGRYVPARWRDMTPTRALRVVDPPGQLLNVHNADSARQGGRIGPAPTGSDPVSTIPAITPCATKPARDAGPSVHLFAPLRGYSP